ncbi:purine and uridine phosphorylase [Aspergillus varians]
MAALTVNDYTIAWICALPIEAAAARVMLDKFHPLPPQSTDPNAYVVGELNGHHIVIALLPAGVYGTVAAATVVSSMRSTFPRLQFGLMVGIGGGVPGNQNDIRLGDVVVSKPGVNHSGVIQYAYGKAVQDGQFEQTGTLNKPPLVILTHINQLQAKRMASGKDDIPQIIQRVLDEHPSMKESFSPPEQHPDYLFHSSYRHANNDEDCGKCDPEQLVKRDLRDIKAPYIHYGLIASADQVMKDSETRDRLAQQHGILCFEMEAAGIMDQLPCLVIRGVCDYCDSHKNKEWQEYAALTAAAYARALLEAVPLSANKQSRCSNSHWIVPFARNPRFVGREAEIARLEEALTPENGPSKIAIYGLGGIGKTQIVLETAYRAREREPSCSLFWIACTSYENVEQQYISIARAVGLQVKPEEAKESVKTYLSQKHAAKWLLVLDNADDLDMWIKDSPTRPALKRFLPHSQHGRILFTTRSRALAVKLASSHSITVPELDKDTGLKMLDKLLLDPDLSTEHKNAVILLEQLAFLPLAISQAAAYINENEIDIPMYLDLLGSQETHITELLSEEFEDEHRYETTQNPIAKTWWISFQQIQRLNQLAIEYLSFMACINPRDIPLSLLPPPTSLNEGTKAIGLLTSYSFVSRQADTTRLTLHRLVHLATRFWLRQSQQLSQRVVKTADRISAVFPNGNPENRMLWREYLPHSLALFQEDDFKSEQGSYSELLERVGVCLYRDGRYRESEELHAQVLDARKRHPNTLTSMANLACTYRSEGKLQDAFSLMEKCSQLCCKTLGSNHPHARQISNILHRWQDQHDSPPAPAQIE